MSWRGELELENGRLDDHVASFANASAFAKATADESEAKEQVEQVDGERVRGCGRCSEIPKNRSDHFFGKWRVGGEAVRGV